MSSTIEPQGSVCDASVAPPRRVMPALPVSFTVLGHALVAYYSSRTGVPESEVVRRLVRQLFHIDRQFDSEAFSRFVDDELTCRPDFERHLEELSSQTERYVRDRKGAPPDNSPAKPGAVAHAA